MRKIILASGSPRRRGILKQIGIDFEVMVSDCEEVITKTIPYEVVQELSGQKAMDIYNKINNDYDDLVVIGADTVVSANNTILGKPKDKDDAYNMISSIENDKHQVYTGVSIIIKKDNVSDIYNKITADNNSLVTVSYIDNSSIIITYSECTDVHVCHLTEDMINEYISTSEPYDKAGGYAIQGYFAKYIEKINGDYLNVVGLPVVKINHYLNLH